MVEYVKLCLPVALALNLVGLIAAATTLITADNLSGLALAGLGRAMSW
ncbi:hypothetical protein KUV61_00475 [Nocardioides marinus]|nr:hypothetical protein [Nocardioides marinus]